MFISCLWFLFLCRRQRSSFQCFPCKRQKKIFSRFFFFIFLFSVRPSHLAFVSLSAGNHVVKSQFVRPSICPSVRLSVCLSVHLLVFLSVLVCVYVRPSVCLSVLPPAGKSNFFFWFFLVHRQQVFLEFSFIQLSSEMRKDVLLQHNVHENFYIT